MRSGTGAVFAAAAVLFFSRLASAADLFPLKAGEKRVYIVFDTDPAEKRKKALHSFSRWEEVLEESRIHGVRAVVVRSSRGKVSSTGGAGIDFGKPERIESEDIYLVTTKGVDWRFHYTTTDDDYPAQRRKLLSALRALPKDRFQRQMDNWILPLPPKPGAKRMAPKDPTRFYYQVLAKGDKRLLRSDVDKDAVVGVGAFRFGEWQMTRWFAPGKGVIQVDQPNPDSESAKEYPIRCVQLVGTAR